MERNEKLSKEIKKFNEMISNKKEINLHSNNISAEGAKALSEALKVNQTLTMIDLIYNNISDEMLNLIQALLERNKNTPKVKKLENCINILSANSITGSNKNEHHNGISTSDVKVIYDII